MREGKVWSAKDYPASTAGTLAMARRFSQQILLNEQQQQQGAQHESSAVANPSMPVATAQATTSAAASNGGAPSSSSTNAGTSAQWVSLSMWDNSIFPAKPCSLDEFAHLSEFGRGRVGQASREGDQEGADDQHGGRGGASC